LTLIAGYNNNALQSCMFHSPTRLAVGPSFQHVKEAVCNTATTQVP